MTAQELLIRFKKLIDELVICLYFAQKGGIDFYAREAEAFSKTHPEKPLIVGDGEPNTGEAISWITHYELKEIMRSPAGFTNILNKTVVVFIFSMWEHDVRPNIAKAESVRVENVKSELMGDIRRIRHCILHHNSIVSDPKLEDLDNLSWKFKRGRELVIEREMMLELLKRINKMEVTIEN